MSHLGGIAYIEQATNYNRKEQVADFITKKSSEDGIEFALKKYGII